MRHILGSEGRVNGQNKHKEALFLAIFIVFCMIPHVSALTDISSCGEMQNMSLNISEDYQLINDIDCSSFNWSPIGNLTNAYSGNFLGNGYKISNLNITCSGYDFCGILGRASIFSFKNFIIENFTLNTDSGQAGIIGSALIPDIDNITIINPSCSGNYDIGILLGNIVTKGNVTNINIIGGFDGGNGIHALIGKITGVGNVIIENITMDSWGLFASPNARIGAIVGEITKDRSGNVTIRNCRFLNSAFFGAYTGGLSGTGGIVGYANITGTINEFNVTENKTMLLIENCYVQNVIMADYSNNSILGGIIGKTEDSSLSEYKIILRNNYVAGLTGSLDSGGGLTGGYFGDIGTGTTIENSYSAQLVTGSGTLDAFGVNNGTIVTQGLFYDINTTGQSSLIAIGYRTDEMVHESNFPTFDFVNTWDIKEGRTYPFLRVFGEESALQFFNLSIDITVINPKNMTYSDTNIPVDVYSNDTEEDTWKYSVNDYPFIVFAPNITLTNSSGELLIGQNKINITVNNTDGFEDSETVYFSISPAPIIYDIEINVYSPQNTTYDNLTVDLQIGANDTINYSWYVLNGGNLTYFVPNTTITAIEGNNVIIIELNNSYGNNDSETVYFTVSLPIPPSPPITGSMMYCYDENTLIKRLVTNITINGNNTYTEDYEYVTCPYGCGEWILGYDCLPSDFIISLVAIPVVMVTGFFIFYFPNRVKTKKKKKRF